MLRVMYMCVAVNIQRARKAAGLTQSQLAEKIGKGFSTVQKYELGLSNPPVEVLRKIAEALGVPLASLVSPKETDTSNYFWSADLEDKLKQVGYSLGQQEDKVRGEYYQWINYPDGTLEVSDEDLKELHVSTNEYLRFKLDELKKKRARDFRPKQGDSK